MNRRLQQFLELEDLTSSRFADIMGIQRSGVSHLLSGRNKPGYDFFNKFAANFPQMNIEWLITGRGKPYKDTETETKTDENKNNEKSVLFDESFLFDSPKTDVQESVQNNFSEENKLSIPSFTSAAPQKSIKRITVFYSDGSFDEFYPNK